MASSKFLMLPTVLLHEFVFVPVLGLSLVLVLGLSGCLAEQPPERPNILFIFSDDQRADAVGAYGNEFISTPSLDNLSEVGFNFRNTHIMGSVHGAVCQPSRAMLMSGRSLYHVGTSLDTVATFPEQLQKTGYITFGTGKWHQSRESFARSFATGRNVFFGGMSDHDATPVQDLLADGSYTEVELKSFSTDLFADAAISFLDEYARSDTSAPFLTYVSFTVPHDPRTPKSAYAEQYASSNIQLPPNFLPVHPFHNGWMTGRDETLAAWPRPEADVRAQIGEYYGLISHMDARIGDILAALDRHGLRDNTIVIFSSDNGLALGSHGLMGKQSLYEHSNRVPLIVSGPGIPSGASDDLVVLYDLFPTIADLTGMELPTSIDGKTLTGIWEKGEDGPRDVLYTVYEDLHRAVTEEQWKLIRYPKIDRNQLFDLKNDPFEMNDLSLDPDYSGQVERLLAIMQSEHDLADDPHPLYVDSLSSDVFDYSKIERKPDRHQPQSVIDKYFGK